VSRPQPISELIPHVVAKLGLSQRLKESQILNNWSELVGEVVAKHSRPMTLDKGYLTVNVDSSPWLNELQRYSKGMILDKLKQKLGKKIIKDIRFRVGSIEPVNNS